MSIQSMCQEYPELRVHLAHLRAMHYQRLCGDHAPILPKLNPRPDVVKEENDDDFMIEVKLKLDPEVVEAFRGTGRGWKQQINEVLLALVGKQQAK